ncbi:MAG: helix-turn-helix domain-containing protein [Hyphomicrobiales bacterium]|nr:MAG: helix-turn-helix domain-containing protein [Hyphomicrobiales bacterium]
MNAIRIACDHCGGLKALADELGFAAPTVSQWISKRRPVPPKQCVRIERITEGRVSRRDLRPDDWRDIWPELAEQVPAAIEFNAGEVAHV